MMKSATDIKTQQESAYFGLSKTMIMRPDDFIKEKTNFVINKTKKLHKAKFFVDKWNK